MSKKKLVDGNCQDKMTKIDSPSETRIKVISRGKSGSPPQRPEQKSPVFRKAKFV